MSNVGGERMRSKSIINVLSYGDWIQEAAGKYRVLIDKKRHASYN